MVDITLPTVGGDANVWGTILNTALGTLNTEKFEVPSGELIMYVTPRGDDANDGRSLHTAKETIAAAVAAGAKIIQLGYGTHAFGADVVYPAGLSIVGFGPALTTLNYTGSGSAFAPATPNTRTYHGEFRGFKLVGPGSGTATTGIALTSVSQASLQDVQVTSFGTGIQLGSSTNGGCVYNNLVNVTASSCGTGFAIHALGSNATRLTGCRANACTIGVDIIDSSSCTWVGGQIEGCTTGVMVTATSNAFADNNVFAATRFETNTTAVNVTSTFVRDFQLLFSQAFGTFTVVDNGTRTTRCGQAVSQWNTTSTAATGGFRFQRNVSAGTETPTLVAVDSVTTSGTPVTVQAETERAAGYFFRGNRGGATYWDVDAFDGTIRMPLAGHIHMTERTTDPTAPAANAARLYLRDNGSGKTQLCVRFNTGAVVVVGTEP